MSLNAILAPLGKSEQSRLKREYAQLQTEGFTIEIAAENPRQWRTQKEGFVFQITFPESEPKFPFGSPQFSIVEPFQLNIQLGDTDDMMWGPARKIVNYLTIFLQLRDPEITPYHLWSRPIEHEPFILDEQTRSNIENAQRAADPVYLILGASPSDQDRHGRTFYDDPQFYLEDAVPFQEEFDNTRYFPIPWGHLDQLAAALPRKFAQIGSDLSTTGRGPMSQSFYLSLRELLKEDGVLFLEAPSYMKEAGPRIRNGSRPKLSTMAYFPDSGRSYVYWQCQQAGFDVEIKRPSELRGNPVIEAIVFPPGRDERTIRPFFVLRKRVGAGGKRRKTRRGHRRHHNRRVQSRKHPKIR